MCWQLKSIRIFVKSAHLLQMGGGGGGVGRRRSGAEVEHDAVLDLAGQRTVVERMVVWPPVGGLQPTVDERVAVLMPSCVDAAAAQLSHLIKVDLVEHLQVIHTPCNSEAATTTSIYTIKLQHWSTSWRLVPTPEGTGARAPRTYTNGWARGTSRVEEQQTRNWLYWPSRKRSPIRLIVSYGYKPNTWRGTTKNRVLPQLSYSFRRHGLAVSWWCSLVVRTTHKCFHNQAPIYDLSELCTPVAQVAYSSCQEYSSTRTAVVRSPWLVPVAAPAFLRGEAKGGPRHFRGASLCGCQ